MTLLKLRSNPPPTLPYELISHIFVIAASGDTQVALGLCLVSTTYHQLAAPLLYKTVALRSPTQIKKFLTKVSDKNKSYVQNLAIRQKYDVPGWKFIGGGIGGENSFKKCTNVVNLALCTPFPDQQLKDLRPKYLHMGFKDDPCLYRPDYAFMANVTHLRLWYDFL